MLTARDEAAPIEETEITYAFDLIIGTADGPESIVSQVTELLWDRYGARYLKDIRPQVLPFEEYGRRYTYKHELKLWAKRVTLVIGWVMESIMFGGEASTTTPGKTISKLASAYCTMGGNGQTVISRTSAKASSICDFPLPGETAPFPVYTM